MSSVVMYGASWCAPCRSVKPQFEKMSDGYLSEMDIDFDYVDVDTLQPAVLKAWGISSVPTILFYSDPESKPLPILGRTQVKMEQEIEFAMLPDPNG